LPDADDADLILSSQNFGDFEDEDDDENEEDAVMA
jgi:hypothetical protein